MSDLYVFGAMLLHKSGKSITEQNLAAVFEAAEIEPEACRVQSIVSAFHDIDIERAIKDGAVLFNRPAAAFVSPVETQKVQTTVEAPKPQEEDIDVFKNLFG